MADHRSRVRLDAIDVRLLVVLQNQGRLSNHLLAKAVGLSASACFQRTRRLERIGIIRGYTATIDMAPVIATITVFVLVSLENQRPADYAKFEEALAQIPEVVEAHLVTGASDFILRVMTRDLDAYVRLMDEFARQYSNIRQYFSYVVMGSKKQTPVPVGHLFITSKEAAP
jgi:Lrp/AsnC family transcriptional regulator of ectoine degradation